MSTGQKCLKMLKDMVSKQKTILVQGSSFSQVQNVEDTTFFVLVCLVYVNVCMHVCLALLM